MSRRQRALHRSVGRIGPLDVTKIGVSRFDLRDPYHLALSATWPVFALAVLTLYVAINILFATLYAAVPGSIGNARPGSVLDAFFFSMETLATVGYGQMYPATNYSHFVSVAEIMSGMAFTAITTGLIFVRFSRPRAKILFADEAVITPYNGRPTLMVRIGNGRMSMLTDLKVTLTALLREHSSEGHKMRRLNDLKLVRSGVPMFALTLTLMHPIDEDSPLFGHTSQSLVDGDIRLFLSVEAQDPGISATVHDIRDYKAHQVRFGMKYADAVAVEADGRTLADLTRISVIEPDGTEMAGDMPELRAVQ
ncbi:MAG TPA: ion channel [Alphaproteobacteria bacterium]|nr:ion channel [Alphaproteobacteria bacterium]